MTCANIYSERAITWAGIWASLFQLSLDQGQLPNDLIKANVVQILKKGKRSLASNYRPLSLTSVTSKILEHIICHHIWKHLEDHNVLSNFQHGFCKWRNCETQLIMAIHDLVSAMNSKKQVDTLTWDFSKAVDRVPHQRLLYKLGHYGIQGSFFPWIRVFLTERTERVALKGVLSNQCFVTSGVPRAQGMVLGLLLFLTCPYDYFINNKICL